MFEFIEFGEQEQFELWLETQPKKVSVEFAFRAAMRLLPVYWDWTIESAFAKKYHLPIIRLLRPLLITGVAARDSNPDTLYTLAILARQAKQETDDDYGVVTSHWDAMSDIYESDISDSFQQEAIGPLYAARAAIRTVYKDEGFSYASFVPYNTRKYIAPKVFEEDFTIVQSSGSLQVIPLWSEDSNPFGTRWNKLKIKLEADAVDWSFWIKWYEAALNGEPMNWEMLERIALIPSEDWEQGPAHLNGLIAKIEEEFLLKATPLAEKIEFNQETQRLRIVPERMSQKALYNSVLETVRDGMDDLRASDQFDNSLSALAPVFESILDRTFLKYLDSPQRVHDDFVKAKRRIQRLIDVGEIAPNDEVIEFVEDLDRGAAHVRANMPQVRASMAALAELRIGEASEDDIKGIHDGAEELAELSEPEMAEVLREDASQILVASSEVPDGAPRVLAPDAAYRLTHRIIESKRILTKENILKAGGGATGGFTYGQLIVEAVEILKRLMQV